MFFVPFAGPFCLSPYGGHTPNSRSIAERSRSSTVNILKYQPVANAASEPEVAGRIEQLVMLAKALATEIETLRAELSRDNDQIDNNGINFYDEVERYEIQLISSALNHCRGNQAQAAKLLHLKSTTLNSKMKHYGLNPVRSIISHK